MPEPPNKPPGGRPPPPLRGVDGRLPTPTSAAPFGPTPRDELPNRTGELIIIKADGTVQDGFAAPEDPTRQDLDQVTVREDLEGAPPSGPPPSGPAPIDGQVLAAEAQDNIVLEDLEEFPPDEDGDQEGPAADFGSDEQPPVRVSLLDPAAREGLMGKPTVIRRAPPRPPAPRATGRTTVDDPDDLPVPKKHIGGLGRLTSWVPSRKPPPTKPANDNISDDEVDAELAAKEKRDKLLPRVWISVGVVAFAALVYWALFTDHDKKPESPSKKETQVASSTPSTPSSAPKPPAPTAPARIPAPSQQTAIPSLASQTTPQLAPAASTTTVPTKKVREVASSKLAKKTASKKGLNAASASILATATLPMCEGMQMQCPEGKLDCMTRLQSLGHSEATARGACWRCTTACQVAFVLVDPTTTVPVPVPPSTKPEPESSTPPTSTPTIVCPEGKAACIARLTPLHGVSTARGACWRCLY